MPVLVATPSQSPLSSPKLQHHSAPIINLARSPSSQHLAATQAPQAVAFPTFDDDLDSGVSSSGTAVPFPKISQRRKLYRGVGTQPWHYNGSGSDSDSDEAPPAPSPPIAPPAPPTSTPDLRPEVDYKRTYSESQLLTPSSSSRGVPGHIRKKSGEIVKSSLKSPSRTSSSQGSFTGRISVPTTPSLEKFVHFDAQLENVRLFNKEQKPAAVSRDGSACDSEESEEEAFVPPDKVYYPGSSEEEKIRSALVLDAINLPLRHSMATPEEILSDNDVKLQRVVLAADARSVEGAVLVRNIAFEKWVAVRFTYDWWQTTSEVTAKYSNQITGANIDVFTFSIRVPDVMARIEEKRLFLAVRYTSGGREFWDNNRNENYQLRFRKETSKRPTALTTTVISNHPPSWPVKSANVDQMADLRKELKRVVREDEESSGLSAWNLLTAKLRRKNIDMEEDRDAKKASSPTNLRDRYSFQESSKVKWEPPKELPRYGGPPREVAAIPFPKGNPNASRANATSIKLPTQPAVSWRSPRGSPRDTGAEHSPKFFLDPREGNSWKHSPHASNGSSGHRTRNHQRGGGYFDVWMDSNAARITPSTGSNVPPQVSSPPALVDEEPKRASPLLGPSTSSSMESITTDDAQGTSETEGYASSNTSFTADIPSSGLEVSTSTDSNSTLSEQNRVQVRFNSYPMDRSYAGSPGAAVPLTTVPAQPWLFSPTTESSVTSTPSITSASSPSQCPSSPSESLLDATRGAAGNERMALESTDYNYFLRRFCYFTGSISQDQYGLTTHRHDSDPTPATWGPISSGSFPSPRRHSLDDEVGVEGTESGHTTPTRSSTPCSTDATGSPGKNAGMRTPRPGSPAVTDLEATPRISYTEGFVRPFRGSL